MGGDNNESYPLLMTEEFWATSQLSVARHTGSIKIDGRSYIICDKTGRDIFQLSAIAARLGKQHAIEPGEPADLVLESLLPAYRKLGRDMLIALIKEGKGESEIKAIAKAVTCTKKKDGKQLTIDYEQRNICQGGALLQPPPLQEHCGD